MASKMNAIQNQLELASAAHGSFAPMPEPAIDASPKPVRVKAQSREGKIHIGAYLHPDFKRSLRIVQAETGKDIQALISDALLYLFRAHNVVK